MLIIIVAFVAGGLLGWALMNARVAQLRAEREIAQARASQLEASREDVKNLFVAEAQRAFRNVSETLVQMNKTQVDGSLETKKVEIDGLLKPLRDMIESYRGELVKSERSRNESYGGLQEQIRSLLTVQESAQKEAARLANVLQSPTTRGNWGEITLRRCVELAGMTEYCDFFVQETIEGEERRRLRPDMLIRLPNNRVIAVDSKAPVTMTADEEQRNALLRRHVEALSRKEYQSALEGTLDFVVLFVPGEQFLPRDGDLFEWGVQKKIFIASPATLVPLLRAVEFGWKAERTEENAKRMHDAGVELFSRFVIVMEKIASVGRALESTVGKYNETIRSIDARLWPKGEEMQRMAGSGKELASLDQLEAVPLQSSKLRLTMQSEEEGTVVPLER
jgi:DNA recombination protein RmuC